MPEHYQVHQLPTSANPKVDAEWVINFACGKTCRIVRYADFTFGIQGHKLDEMDITFAMGELFKMIEEGRDDES